MPCVYDIPIYRHDEIIVYPMVVRGSDDPTNPRWSKNNIVLTRFGPVVSFQESSRTPGTRSKNQRGLEVYRPFQKLVPRSLISFTISVVIVMIYTYHLPIYIIYDV